MSEPAKQAPRRTDPDNVFATPGKKDTTKTYVFIPQAYEGAREAIKAAGGTWVGSQWQMSKEAFEGAEGGIRAAARADKAALEAKRDAKAADKPALSEEEAAARKAEKAEAGRARAAEADKTRFPVIAGHYAVGETLRVGGADVAITKLGTAVDLTEESAARYMERFPGTEFKAGDSVAFAYFEEPEQENAPSM